MSAPWPDGKRFAFSIFDDPDAQTLAAGRIVPVAADIATERQVRDLFKR